MTSGSICQVANPGDVKGRTLGGAPAGQQGEALVGPRPPRTDVRRQRPVFVRAPETREPRPTGCWGGFLGAFQNGKTMCYAAGVAESGGPDPMTRDFGSRSGVLDFPCHTHPEVLHTTAEVEL